MDDSEIEDLIDRTFTIFEQEPAELEDLTWTVPPCCSYGRPAGY